MERLARLRELKGFSQRALAKESGVSPATIYELENGRRRPNPSTLRKLAGALEVEVADLLGAEYPKAEARSPEQPSFNGLLEEERRASWTAGVDNARRLRESGRARMKELLAAWQTSRERGELPAARRGYLDEIKDLLDKAYGAPAPLVNMFFAGLMQRAAGEWEADWEEVLAAERFYWTLIEMMRNKGFVIKERESEPPEIEAPEAA